MLKCIRQCVCVCRGTGSRNRVEERVASYRANTKLLVVTRRRYSSSLHELHENSNQNYARTILRVTTIA